MAPVADSTLEAAVRDLENRTLIHLRGQMTKLVYLSSTRNYNTGEYQHEGLAQRYGKEAAQQALAQCHEAAFQDLVVSSLADVTAELALYIDSTGAEREKVLASWRHLQAYRVLIPTGCDALKADFFATNIKIALEVLGMGAEIHPD